MNSNSAKYKNSNLIVSTVVVRQCVPACHTFRCKNRELQIFISSVGSRTLQNFAVLLNSVWGIYFMDPVFHLIQY